jgi:hypothetical protein
MRVCEVGLTLARGFEGVNDGAPRATTAHWPGRDPIGVIGFGIERTLSAIERRVVHWAGR